MKKLTRISSVLLAILILATCAFSLLACNEEQPAETPKAPTVFTVTIDRDGTLTTSEVEEGNAFTLPTDTQKDDYNFVGWYLDGELITTPTITPTSDITIIGKWEEIDYLAIELTNALKAYLATDAFQSALSSAKTTQARIPLLYLRYVQGDFYSDEVIMQCKKYLNMMDEILENGEIKDNLFPTSNAGATGWYGVLDYLYSWSAIYNQYQQWCHESGNTDTSYSLYFDAITSYLKRIDTYLSNSQKTYTFNGESVTQSNLYYKGYNAINNISNKNSRLSYDQYVELLSLVKEATGNEDGHAQFLAEYAKIDFETLDAQENNYTLFSSVKSTIMPLWKACMPTTTVAFGYGNTNVAMLTAHNLGLDIEEVVPYCTQYMLDYYKKNDDGKYIKNGGTPNWVGFSGRPLAGSVLKDYEEYDLAYEKTMQGYFPFTDGWNQPLDEMINMDRLCNYYNHDLNAPSSVDARYGLLYGYMNGIDMEHYVKEVYHSEVCEGDECEHHIDEEDGTVYNIVSLWRNTLKTDDDGNYVIDNVVDMAVAIAYIAHSNGIDAPSPLGIYNSANAVIDLK